MRSALSLRALKRDRSEAGFTLAEALVALSVLSLAMLQISEIMAQFARTTTGLRTATTETNRILDDYHLATANGRGAVDSSSVQTFIVLDDEQFDLSEGEIVEEKPCLFDATGRRCR